MMSTINSSQAGGWVHPRRTRQLILVGLILLLALAVAAATLHSVSGRNDTMTFTAAGIRELVVKVHAGRIELIPSLTGTVQVTTTRRWSLWTPPSHHTRPAACSPAAARPLAPSASPAPPSTSA
jgi:hypothetical protein